MYCRKTTKIRGIVLKIFKILLRTVLWIAAGAVLVAVAVGVAAYVPGVQKFALGKVAEIVARETGLRVEVASFRVRFPLGVSASGVDVVTASGDTLAHLSSARVRAGLWPLLRGNVRVMNVEARGLRVAWRDTVSGMTLDARVERFEAGSASLDPRLRTVRLTRASIEGGGAAVAMGAATESQKPEADTAAFDWNIEVGRFDLDHFGVALDMEDGEAGFPAGGTRPAPSFDYRHVRAEEAAVSVRNFQFAGDRLALSFDGLAFVERSGLQVTDGGGEFRMVGGAVSLDDFSLRSAASEIEGRAEAGEGIARMDGATPVSLSLAATVSPAEAALFASLPKAVEKVLAGRRLTLAGEVNGTLDELYIERFVAELPTHARFTAEGRVRHALSPDAIAGGVKVEGELADVEFAREFIPDAELRERVRIPRGMRLAAEADFSTRSVDVRSASLRLDTARVEVRGSFDLNTQAYEADVRVASLPIDRFLPRDSVGMVAGTLTASGRGFDPATMTATATLALDRARYGSMELGRVSADIAADRGDFKVRIDSRSELVDGRVSLAGHIGRDTLWTSAAPSRVAPRTVSRDTPRPAAMSVTAYPASNGVPLAISLTARLDSTYVFFGGARQLVGPADITAAASPAGTRASVLSGDMEIEVSSPLAPDTLARGAMGSMNELNRQLAARQFDADSLQRAFPEMSLTVRLGRANFLHDVARAYGFDFRTARADATTGGGEGFHIDAAVVSPTVADLSADTVALHAVRNGARLDYALRMVNRPGDRTELGFIGMSGSVGGNELTANIRQRNSAGATGFDFTVAASLRDSTVRVELAPDPILAYERWKVGDDGDFHHTAGAFDHPTIGAGNWIESDQDGKLRADLHLTSEKAASPKGATATINWGAFGAVTNMIANASRHIALTSSSLPGISDGAVRLVASGIDLAPMLDLFPTMPRLGGSLSSDLTFGFIPATAETPGVMAARGTVGVQNFSYEGQRVADVDADVNFGTDAGGTMKLDASMRLEKQTALTARGTYGTGSVDFTVDIPSVPLAVVQRMLPAGTATLSGNFDGRLRVVGDVAKPQISGDVGFVDGRARINMVGTEFGISSERIAIADNRVSFKDWGLTAPNNQRLRVNGSVDIADAAAPVADLAIRAINFRFVDSGHIGGSQVYGRAAMSADVTARGRLDAMMVRGDVRLSEDTDVVYIMREESSLKDERQHIVRFTSFEADSLDAEDVKPLPARRAGVDMLVRLVAREGMKATVSLDEANENRVELTGGGDLSMSVNREGDVRLAGRYVLSGGTLHYRPPLIPQKVFAVADGSYVEWRGKPLEPELHITASQSTDIRIDRENGSSEDVRFDISADITGSLRGMDIRFDLAAPDNMAIQNELLAMSAEGRMQQALSMMIYNRYSGPGVASKGMAIDARGQINSFISREINQWARNNLRGVDFSMGIKTSEDALEGASQTDYSYRVSKRLLDDRMKITIGGSVSDRGANDAGSLLEDIELEYRLNRRENMFFKLYRLNKRASMLEGEITETGAGFIIRKKVTKITNIFKRASGPFGGGRRRSGDERRDSLPPPDAAITETKGNETEN